MLLWLEFGLCVVAAVLTLIAPQLGASWFDRLEKIFGSLARRQRLAVIVVGMLALALRAALLPILPIPEPSVSDEFGYLLQADTFAHGRLTNPTHPMWVHFETLSVIHRPTYQCFAQPMQGIILAAGKVLLGHPFWGVWLSMGLMSAAICWMLQGWLPPGWALLGGVLAVLRLGTFGYWANSYWGGAAGAIGGVLVLGALPRIFRTYRLRDALILSLGLGILMNSRPFEGFVFNLPIALALLAWMSARSSPPLRISFPRLVVPLALSLSVAFAATGYYFWRVTGDPLHMPYQVEEETYGSAPLLLWQSPRPLPTYHHVDLENIYLHGELTRYKVAITPAGFLYLASRKFYGLWSFYLGPTLTFPILMLFVSLPDSFSPFKMSAQLKWVTLATCVTLVALLFELYFWPHYAAVLVGSCFLFILLAMRRLREWTRKQRLTGLFMVRAIVVICVLIFLVRLIAVPLHIPIVRSTAPTWYETGSNAGEALGIMSAIEQRPGDQLVVVRYSPHHIPDHEWVHNEADIDSSHVVWARDMGELKNEELLAYFRDREVWILTADDHPPRLSLLRSASSQAVGGSQ